MNKINWNFKRHFSVELQKKKNDAERQAYIQASPTIFHLQLSLYFPVRLQRAPSSSLSGCVFHTLFNIKGLDCFRKKNSSNACIFPSPASQGLCVSTNAQELVCSARERVFVCLCVRSSVAGADQPKGPSGSCEAAAVRCLGPVRGHATASAAAVPLPPFVFFLLPTPRTSRRKHRAYLPTLPLLSHQQAECVSA